MMQQSLAFLRQAVDVNPAVLAQAGSLLGHPILTPF